MSDFFTNEVIPVSALNRLVRLAIERALPIAWISGEVSNLTRAPSGHWYFTLKDASAAVRCAMFRNRNQFIDWRPENGMQVEVKAQATLYEPRGEFQLTVEAMRRAGLGALFEAFAKLKEKLEREGLFDSARKRTLPIYPKTIGIVTSPKAAALRDVLTTLKRRWPSAPVVLYPTLVQGENAAGQIVDALRTAGARQECDVLLLVRGGGSIEDLWSFNVEAVARAIADCPIPVVAGVGHETDFTIADFVADLRAPTPTGAAQLATPDSHELLQQQNQLLRRLHLSQRRRMDTLAQRLDGMSRRLVHPAARIAEQRRHLDHLAHRLAMTWSSHLGRKQHAVLHQTDRLRHAQPRTVEQQQQANDLARRLKTSLASTLQRRHDRLRALESHLAHLNPDAVLGRGYSLVRDMAGNIVRDSDQLNLGEKLAITLAKGAIGAEVTTLGKD